ncbi:hypothetical protein BWQ96_09108 [Gracilariopsis chorda]|uniref:Uncharacterized protein n=1 Tax=Gracilariopsis chorda TaxID=448386 RepID=A0A2V3IBH9_9FLOR|nr:hypothetical protein BWQ96_10845 [Gracilariopsis chorda]PXF41166.1 hypothetical protein BWQ96_09108 [Gracilariopsis chorda]|eukprot:PXF39467.1 hypothetical protein BWQ96_10845 [Gracilariopsis chorda]
MQSILIPNNAEVLAVEQENSDPEVLHILSEEPKNVVRVSNENLNDAIQKAIWRENGKNRERENELFRKRYKIPRGEESSHDRAQ